ncbi:hypothetical protein [Mycobacterium paragordonae]|uniref:Uncharacterized protein n=1 Tax=Mycobacterium paragordonae TaxID=1389713 RepID=A0A4R5WS47_9MYCO|nr:hypothetical protein [Mycobacterium paragordonae]MDP7735388.1 hypothetical protein [Mycobacterium paragordonae]TDK93495.1 hypothetical protein EUA02_19185 [Mycobacterium paragordonae]TDL04940.1 hypothetical protein EUA05_20330 [Mycobacterium paragordonae]
MTSDPTNTPAPSRRYSTGALVGAGIAGVALGAAAAFTVTGLVFTVRVELPPPPYPQFSSAVPTPPPTPPTAGSSVAPTSAPGSLLPSRPPLPGPPGPP